jgi:hypothetical protein
MKEKFDEIISELEDQLDGVRGNISDAESDLSTARDGVEEAESLLKKLVNAVKEPNKELVDTVKTQEIWLKNLTELNQKLKSLVGLIPDEEQEQDEE